VPRGSNLRLLASLPSTITLRMLLIAAGLYISLFGSSIVRQYAKLFGITALPIALPKHPWPAVIVTLKNRTQSPVVERFIETAQTVAKSFPGLIAAGVLFISTSI
jgi:DNA-binding transcriptional LysR family regulator